MDRRQRIHDSLQRPGYFCRVTVRDHRAIDEAMAGATLLDDGARIDGAVIEASYAVDEPPLLRRLGDDGVPRLLDPQSLRFVGENFRETSALTRLPYAPSRRINALDFDATRARQLARGALLFAQSVDADVFLAPGLPIFDHDHARWVEHNREILRAACNANGGPDVQRRPMLALIAPGAKALADPAVITDWLLDHPIDGVYVQPLTLDPVRDSLSKLTRFVQFLHAIRDAGFPIVVGRVGAFGLVLQSLGFGAFDSGLGLAESHSLSSSNRRMSDRERARRAEHGGGGPSTRVYLEPLKTTLPARVATEIVNCLELRQHFLCSLGCCRFRDLSVLHERARPHYLFTRRAEVDRLQALPVPAMRLHETETQLRAADDLAARVRRALPASSPPTFGHLERWLSLLATEQGVALVA
jgi:hypothetical protein